MLKKHRRILFDVFLIFAVAIGLAWRVAYAWDDLGMYHPDEIYQVLEPAHELAYGYGLTAWEWVFGLRNYVLPGIYGGLLKLLQTFGLQDPEYYTRFLRILNSIFNVFGVLALLCAHRRGWFEESGFLVASTFYLFLPFSIYIAPRSLTGAVSTPLVMLGAVLVFDQTVNRRRLLFGGILMSLATLIRLQNGYFCVWAIASVAYNEDMKKAGGLFGVFFVGAIVYGIIDWTTLGYPYLSAARYLEFNFLMEGASDFGTAPVHHYAVTVWNSAGIALCGIALLGVLSARRIPFLFAATVGYLVIMSTTPHKEFRFIYPAVGLWGIQVGVGYEVLFGGWDGGRLKAWVAPTLSGWALASSLVLFPSLTFRDVGHIDGVGLPLEASAHGYLGDVNRLLFRARQLPEVCGIYVKFGPGPGGGYTYLHRNIPIYYGRKEPRDSKMINAVIAEKWAHPRRLRRATSGNNGLFVLNRGCPVKAGRKAGYMNLPEGRKVREFVTEHDPVKGRVNPWGDNPVGP